MLSDRQTYAGVAIPKSTPSVRPGTISWASLSGISNVKFKIKLLFLSNIKDDSFILYSLLIILCSVCFNSIVFSFILLEPVTTVNSILLTHLITISSPSYLNFKFRPLVINGYVRL